MADAPLLQRTLAGANKRQCFAEKGVPGRQWTARSIRAFVKMIHFVVLEVLLLQLLLVVVVAAVVAYNVGQGLLEWSLLRVGLILPGVPRTKVARANYGFRGLLKKEAALRKLSKDTLRKEAWWRVQYWTMPH